MARFTLTTIWFTILFTLDQKSLVEATDSATMCPPGISLPTPTTPPPVSCGNESFTDDTGFISSPGYPYDNYPNNANCTYTIDLQQNSSITLTFLDIFLLESCCDWVKIDASSCGCSQIYQYAGYYNTPPALVFPYCSQISIQFHSDSTDTEFGFGIIYSSSPASTMSTLSAPLCPSGLTTTTYPSFPTWNPALCGTVWFSGPYGVISSQGYPYGYPNSANCNYTIGLNGTSSITLTFSSPFSLESCCDWVAIDASSCRCDQYRYSYTGAIVPSALTFSNCDRIVIRFHSDSSVAYAGFSLTYDVGPPSGHPTASCPTVSCGNGNFTGLSGFISSPGYPYSSYPNNANCTYTIDLQQNSSITLTFQNIFMLETCCDWVKVDASSCGCNQVYRYTGYYGYYDTPPTLVFPYCRRISIQFYSDSSDAETGFGINYSASPASTLAEIFGPMCPSGITTPIYPSSTTLRPASCGTGWFSGQHGVISSPGYPYGYPNSVNCSYTIGLNGTSSINLAFSSPFSFESCCDWVTIDASGCGCDQYYYSYTGAIVPSALTFSNCDRIVIRFHSDISVAYAGFSLIYDVGPPSGDRTASCPPGPPMTTPPQHSTYPPVSCGNGNFTGQSGVISSPGYPYSTYPNNANCTYTIDLQQNSSITLTFLDIFMLEACCDWVKIDASSCGCGHVYQYTGFYNIPPTLVFPNCRRILIQFHSDSTDTEFGFGIDYSASPASTISTLSAPLCPSGITTPTYPSSTTLRPARCGTGWFSGQHGVISSPGYPSSYPNSVNCSYTIGLNGTSSINLTFSSPFSFESCCDWVAIDASGCGCDQYYYSYTGASVPSALTFPNCNQIVIRFHSDYSVAYAGFSLTYDVGPSSGDGTASCPPGLPMTIPPPYSPGPPMTFPPWYPTDAPVSCGNGYFTGQSGVISSPGYPYTNYPNNANCTYTIDLQQNSSITLMFLDIFMLESCCDWVKIDASSCGCSQIYQYAGYYYTPPTLVFPYCSRISIQFHSDSTDSEFGFGINYNSIPASTIPSHSAMCPSGISTTTYPSFTTRSPASCGAGWFSGQHGVISSPGYPSPYPNMVNCNYTIGLNETSSITLTFSSPFSFESCCDWVAIDASGCGCDEYYYTYTGASAPSALTFPNCDRIVIRFHSDSSVVYSGFSLTYDVSPSADDSTASCPSGSPVTTSFPYPTNPPVNCGTVWYTGQQGVITTPGFPSYASNFANCTYLIDLSQYSSITLTFMSPFYFDPSISSLMIDASSCGCSQIYQLTGYNPPPALTFAYCNRITIQINSFSIYGYYYSSGFSISYNAYPVSGLTTYPSILGPGDYELTRSKPARQSSTYDDHAASFALDGNPATHSVAAADARSAALGWWQVDLGDVYNINNLTIINTNDPYEYQAMSNFVVTIGVTDSTDPMGSRTNVCYTYPNTSSPVQPRGSLSMNCTVKPTRGRYVTISRLPGGFRPDIISISEVYIYAANNIDLGHTKSASQFQIYNNDQTYDASKALDGYLSTCSFQTTGAGLATWWRVDLGMVYPITGIIIINTDHPGLFDAYGNLTSFVVYVDSVVNVTSASPVCYDYPSDGAVAVSSGQPMSLRCRSSPMNGRYITISARNNAGNNTMVLCEVYVFMNSGGSTSASTTMSSTSQSTSTVSSPLSPSQSSTTSSSDLPSSSYASNVGQLMANPSSDQPKGYGSGDMVALGLVLGCLLLICLIIIIVLIIVLRSRDRRFKNINAFMTSLSTVDGQSTLTSIEDSQSTNSYGASTTIQDTTKTTGATGGSTGAPTCSNKIDFSPFIKNRENLEGAIEEDSRI